LLEETKAYLKLYDPDLYGAPCKRAQPSYSAY